MVRAALAWVNDRLGRRALVWAALVALFALVLQLVPLFNVLGFDYAFALGLVTAFAAADVGHGAIAAARRAGRQGARPRPRPRDLIVLTATAAGGALGLLVLPLLVSMVNAARVKNCNLGAGLVFFALLPASTALYAAVAGLLAGLALPRRGRLVAYLLPVASLAWSLLRLYFDPPVFAYDPFGGYFPGPIYDEALQPPPRLAWFRLTNLIWIATAVAVAAAITELWPGAEAPALTDSGARRRRGARLAAAALLAIASIVLFANRGRLGFHVGHARLEQVLAQESRTDHFVLHTVPRAHSEGDLALTLRDFEFRYQQLARVLGAAPAGPIHVFEFPSSDLKKDLVGAAHTLYAKPWTREIFIQVDRFPARRLRHELAHVFAGAFGDPVFGVALAIRFRGPLPVPRLASGLIEGLAEAADFGDPDGRSTVHQEARAMVAAGLAPPLAKVVGAGFTTVAGPRAYTLAGSFSHFLLRTYGNEKFRALYRSGGDFDAVYGEPLERLEPKFRAFLETQPLEAREQARAKERFRRPAIFQKVCARELAARVDTARDVMYAEPPRAVALLESVCRDDPHEPVYKLDLADAFAAAGQSDRTLKLAAEVETDDTITEPLRARAATLAASVHVQAGRIEEARRALVRAERLATDEGERRTLQAKLRALADEDARRTLGRALFGDGPGRGVDGGLLVYLMSEFARRFPDEALGPYLLARQLSYRDAALALPLLDEACPLAAAAPQPAKRPIPLGPLFLRECHRMVGDAAFRTGDYPRSRAAFERLREGADNEAERLRASDFLERIAWQQTRR